MQDAKTAGNSPLHVRLHTEIYVNVNTIFVDGMMSSVPILHADHVS